MKTRRVRLDASNPDPEVVAEAAAILRAGGLVAFPTETVYGLGAIATDEDAVRRLFAAKGRPEKKPISILVASVVQVEHLVRGVPEVARELMARFFPGPLTLVLARHARVPDVVTAGTDTVGVRMPNHAVPLALIEAVGLPLAAPSANLSGARSAVNADEVMEDLDGRIELVLDAGPSPLREASTVLDLTADPPRILRQGSLPAEAIRRYVPGLAA